MSKKDDIKEQIGMLKFWLGILVGSVLAMVGLLRILRQQKFGYY